MIEWLLPFFLIYFSLQDIKTKEISDFWILSLTALGIVVNGVDLPFLLSFTLSVLLYVLRMFAAGDMFILILIEAWSPVPYASVISLLLASFLAFLRGVLNVVYTREWGVFITRALSLSALISIHPLLAVLTFFERRLLEWGVLLLPLSVFVGNPLPYVPVLLFLLLLLEALRRRTVFTREVEVGRLREGDVLAEVVDERGRRHPLSPVTEMKVLQGEIKPVHSVGPDGISRSDIERLRRVVERVRVRETIPFVPYLATGYILLLFIVTCCPDLLQHSFSLLSSYSPVPQITVEN